MPFDIEEFKTRGLQAGLMRPAYFFARITPPRVFGSSDRARQLQFLCTSAQLPSVSIDTQTVMPYGQGVSIKKPTGVTLGDINLSFYADGEGNSIEFFYSWLRSIVSWGDMGENFNGAYPGEVRYRDDYQTTIEIYQYNGAPLSSGRVDEAGGFITCFKFFNAFPVNVGDTQLNWSAGEEIQTVNVAFTFEHFTVTKYEAAPLGSASREAADALFSADLDQYAVLRGSASSFREQAFNIVSRLNNLSLNDLGSFGAYLQQGLNGIREAQNIRDALNATRAIPNTFGSNIRRQINSSGAGGRFP